MSIHHGGDRNPLVLTDNPVDDPTWQADFNVAGAGPMTFGETGHAQESVRTNHGALDLLHAVQEEAHEWIEREARHEKEDRHWPPNAPKPKVIQTWPHPADSWRGNTYAVGTETRIVQQRNDRVRCVVTNWGPAIVYIAHDSGTGLSEPQFNAVQIPVNGSREFRTKGELWAYPTPTNTPIVDVQDEYGLSDIVDG